MSDKRCCPACEDAARIAESHSNYSFEFPAKLAGQIRSSCRHLAASAEGETQRTHAQEGISLLKKMYGESAAPADISATLQYYLPEFQRELRARPSAEEVNAVCEWKWTEEYWETGCGRQWVLTDSGTPAEHGMKFCYHCGKTLVALDLTALPGQRKGEG